MDWTLVNLVCQCFPPTLETYFNLVYVSKLFYSVVKAILFEPLQSTDIVCCLGSTLQFGRKDWSDERHPLTLHCLGRIPTLEEWKKVFRKLNVDPTKCNILIGERSDQFMHEHEIEKLRMLKMLFEDFGILGVFVQNQATLALVATGHQFATLMEIEDDKIQITPISYSPDNALASQILCGSFHVRQELCSLLQKRGYAFHLIKDQEELDRILKKYCYFSANLAQDISLAEETTTLLSEYQSETFGKISLGAERFLATEVLFKEDHVSNFFAGWLAMDVEERWAAKEFVIFGELAHLPGFVDRFEKEWRKAILKKWHTAKNLSLRAHVYHGHPFAGALAALRYGANNYLSRQEYDERKMHVFCYKVKWVEYVFDTLCTKNL